MNKKKIMLLATAIMLFVSGVSAKNKENTDIQDSVSAQKNFNLRENNGNVVVAVSGGANFSLGEAKAETGAINISVTQNNKWVHYGLEAGWRSDGTTSVKAILGPKIGERFYVASALIVGLGQVREELLFNNPNNGDMLNLSSPSPRFLVGAKARLGYNFNRFALFLQASYTRAISYSSKMEMAHPWTLVSHKNPKDMLSLELGVGYVINDTTTRSGDNCLTASLGGGYSSMGGFASVDVTAFNRLGDSYGHSYGGTYAFYFENGNAEIGAKYNIVWTPKGSDGIYNGSIGISAVMGQYQRTWAGGSAEDPERVQAGGNRYSFGGGASLELTPVALQLGRVNLSLFGNVGFRALTSVVGEGDLSYNAKGLSENIFLHYAGGIKLEIALW